MTRERRSLWGSISTSKKVNQISLKAALLYTWAIPHFDDEGFQDGEPRELKRKIVPYRDEITIEDIKNAIIELNIKGLWKIFHKNSTVFIQDPVFSERQSFSGLHKIPSKIKSLINNTPETVLSIINNSVQVHGGSCISEVKLSEVKLSEVKAKPCTNNTVPGDGASASEGASPHPMDLVKKLAKQKAIEKPTEKELERRQELERQKAVVLRKPEPKDEEVPFR
jgi:hypothetical protein